MGTVTEDAKSGIYKIKFDWASSTAGACSDATTGVYNGQIVRMISDPDGGATQPTAAFDVVVNDDDGYDVLNGGGADLSNSANTYKAEKDGLGYVQGSKLTCVVSNAGDTKGGVIILYLKPMDVQVK